MTNQITEILDSNKVSNHDADTTFKLNTTGNIFYSVTTPEDKLGEDTKDLFNSVTVLFAAMAKAMADNDKTLFDYDAWNKIISQSKFFVPVEKYEKNIQIEANSLSIDTQVIQQLLPGLTSGSSMDIAKGVLQAMNGTFEAHKTDENTKFAHLMFICEEIFGAPSVTVRLFYASAQSHVKITSSPCHKTTSKTFTQVQKGDTFLFVEPATIAKFAKTFTEDNEQYDDLIKTFDDCIKSSEQEVPAEPA
jgi:hypothetical protein